MRIAFIETSGLTNDLLRAVAGAAPNCVGYPDGVPESWRDVAPVKQGGDLMPDLPMKHFTDETRGGAGGGAAYPMRCAGRFPLHYYGGALVCQNCGNPAPDLMASRAAYPDHELDPAALLGPVVEPVDWRSMTYADLQPGDLARFAGDLFRAHIASRGDWPDGRGDDEC